MSQLGQDKFVFDHLNGLKNGYFVEVGASDGLTYSNTHSLEKYHGWTGICIEPGDTFGELVKNRTCICDNSCIFSENGKEVEFTENEKYIYGKTSLYSGITSTIDKHIIHGKVTKKVTKTLETVLDQRKAPKCIDYLSLDTEGSEWEILKNFPFDKYRFRVLTIEHNFVEPKRTYIRELLEQNGYVLIENVDSKWDDWFVEK